MWNNQDNSVTTLNSEDAAVPIKKLESLESKLVKMMEQLSIRSLRHIRQIRADLRQMTQSVAALKRAGSGVDDSRPGVAIRPNGHTRCPDEFVGVGRWRTCYRFSNFDASWHEAREYCSAFGANLVSLDSMKEAYIIDYLIKSHPGSIHLSLNSLLWCFYLVDLFLLCTVGPCILNVQSYIYVITLNSPILRFSG